MTGVDPNSFFAILAAATVAALLVAVMGRRAILPVVVVEVLLGILIGPQVLDLARTGEFIDFIATGGLGMLFFFAGYEIDFERIKGVPLKLGVGAWLVGILIAYAIAGLLQAGGVVVSGLYTGTAVATTALGALIPMLGDRGDLRTRFGTFVLASGAIGEFGPILLLTIGLSTAAPLDQALMLGLFAAIAVAITFLAVRATGAGWGVLQRGMRTSGQLPTRLVVLLVFGLVAVASELGLDLLLGGFVAGIVVRAALRGREHEAEELESKLFAVGYGFFIPFFFVVSGMAFDLDSLTSSGSALLKLPLFLVVFVAVRALPGLYLFRRELELRDRLALGFYSATQLPLVVAITTVALDEGHMHSDTASALVGAAILSTAIFPAVAGRLRPAPVAQVG